MKRNKNRYLITLETKWPILLVFLILNSVLFLFVAHFINDPKDTQIFYMFLGSYEANTVEIRNNIMDYENFPGLRRFYVKESSLNSPSFTRDLNTYGLVHSDILILSQSTLDNLPHYSAICQDFDMEFASREFGSDYTYLSNDEGVWGIEVYNASSKKGIYTNLISYTSSDSDDENFYMVFKKKSIHLGDMVESSKTNYAITIAKGILENGFEA